MVTKFMVDGALGGLVKWLRFCGFDTSSGKFRASDLQGLPLSEPGVILVTSQAGFRKLKRPDILVIETASPEGQLAEVIHRLGLSWQQLAPLSRCVRCNEALRQVGREQLAGRLPDHVLHNQADFFECPRCRRLYWPGSHIQTIMDRLRAAVSGRGVESGVLPAVNNVL